MNRLHDVPPRADDNEDKDKDNDEQQEETALLATVNSTMKQPPASGAFLALHHNRRLRKSRLRKSHLGNIAATCKPEWLVIRIEFFRVSRFEGLQYLPSIERRPIVFFGGGRGYFVASVLWTRSGHVIIFNNSSHRHSNLPTTSAPNFLQ